MGTEIAAQGKGKKDASSPVQVEAGPQLLHRMGLGRVTGNSKVPEKYPDILLFQRILQSLSEN